MKRYYSNICSSTTSAAALRWQVVELTLKYANFEAKFRYQNQIGTPMIVGQNLDIVDIFNIYSFESRPAKRVASVVIFNSRGFRLGLVFSWHLYSFCHKEIPIQIRLIFTTAQTQNIITPSLRLGVMINKEL